MKYTIDEYEEAKKNKTIKNIPVSIRSIEDYEKLLKIVNNENIEIIIDKKLAQELIKGNLEISLNFNVTLEIDDMIDLSNEELDELETKIKIDKVNIKSKIEYREDDSYSIKDYRDLRRQIDYIVSFTDESQSELEKFLTIYKIIGESIVYDEFIDSYLNSKPSVWKDNQNLIRRFIRRSYCLCWLFQNFRASFKMCRN